MMPSTTVATIGMTSSSNDASRSRRPPFNPIARSRYVESSDVIDSGKRRSLFRRTATAPRTNASTAGEPRFWPTRSPIVTMVSLADEEDL